MSFIFSAVQLAEISRLYGIANLRNANGNVSNYADVYAYIRDQISGYPQLVPAIDSVARWFTSANPISASYLFAVIGKNKSVVAYGSEFHIRSREKINFLNDSFGAK